MSDLHLDDEDDETNEILNQYKRKLNAYYSNEKDQKQQLWYPMFSHTFHQFKEKKNLSWVKKNQQQFLDNSPNQILKNRWFSEECGSITSLVFSNDGERIIVGHANGLIQMRHGHNGNVLATLRNIQFPPKPIYALEFSKHEERVCYAACTDGIVYRIEIPFIDTSSQNVSTEMCIRKDPALEWLNTQFYGSPGTATNATPFILQRTPALALGVTADSAKIIVGYSDASLKIYDMQTQEAEHVFKVHKIRLQFIPKKLQRVHSGQICAVRCHSDKPYMFASAAWDKTLRIWDTRCKVGCMMTFEGVNVCHDAIDLNREHAISGSWSPAEALCTWDLVAKKRLNIIRVQNRRPDVDGEYIYACRFWRSSQFNRKGKYGIIGGSGTGCVEVINLHNRYITCSYPAPGTVLAVASFNDRIAFGGTSPVFNIVSFHDPKHEEYSPDETPKYDFAVHPVTMFERLREYNLSPRTSEIGYGEGEGEELVEAGTGESEKKLEKTNRSSARASRPELEQPDSSRKSLCTDISKQPFRKSRIITVTNIKSTH
ncbi:hypothetical protein O0L34_g6935 [Tuta absoluta]|nr:hypothetical protein O0L34_g6935 [Tuta absoluta]